MSSARVVLTNDLDLDARKEFIAATRASIQSESHGGRPVEVDCVAVESFGPVDVAVIGMLVTLARASQRNGGRRVSPRVETDARTVRDSRGRALLRLGTVGEP